VAGGKMSSNDNEKKCKSRAAAFYKKFDSMYSGVLLIDDHLQLSTNGESIIDDIEYYLRHPKYRVRMEGLILEQLKVFAETALKEE